MVMIQYLRELHHYRDLLLLWILRDIKVRYKQSILGVGWAVIQPLSSMVIFTVIFSSIAHVPSDGLPYPLFSYSALLPWTLLSTSLTVAVPSLVNNMNLITKSPFPREILPISAVLASLADFSVATIVFAGMMIYYHVTVNLSLVVAPLILIVQLALILGVTMWASALNVFYRDIRFVIPLATQLWMYMTPIIYPLSMVPEGFRGLYVLNPMAGIVDSYRCTILLAEYPNWLYLGISTGISLLVFISGYYSFKKSEPHFADLI